MSVPSSLEEHLILAWSEVVNLSFEGAVTLQNEILRKGKSLISLEKHILKKISSISKATSYPQSSRIHHTVVLVLMMASRGFLEINMNNFQDVE